MQPTKAVFQIAAGLLASATALPAQSYYPHHNFTFGFGGAQPQAELTDLFRSRPGISVGYGYRFHRYFQADIGFDTVFGAAGIRDYLQTDFGYLRIRDYEFFIPFGGRAILPLFDGRLLLSGGGGPAFMHYTELLHQPSDYLKFDCPVCTARSGWAYYALASATAYLDRSQHFRIGATAKSYRGHTDGDPLVLPGVRTRDRWLTILGEFGFSF